MYNYYTILLTKTNAAQNEVALRYYRVRGLYFLAVVFVTTVYQNLSTKDRSSSAELRCQLCIGWSVVT